MPGNEKRDMEGQERGITKKQEEILRSDGYIHYLDCGDGFIGIYRCQNVSNYAV